MLQLTTLRTYSMAKGSLSRVSGQRIWRQELKQRLWRRAAVCVTGFLRRCSLHRVYSPQIGELTTD